jgi:D-alanine-D-alanine ligase-like ATP-grasp enzyme
MSQNNPPASLQRAHYPYVTRSILRLMEKGFLTNVVSINIEPTYGFAVRLTYSNGMHRVTYGNDLGLNNAAACDLAKDKGYTKFMLRAIGIECPDGDEFVLPWWEEVMGRIRRNKGNDGVRGVDQAPGYIEQNMGYPVYLKPVNGSKGGDIFTVQSQAELEMVMELYNEKRIRVVMAEAPINMPDYRIVSLDGELISAYRRVPLTVVGNGTSTIKELLEQLQEYYAGQGRDTRLHADDERIRRHLAQRDMTILDVPEAGQSLALVPISNLSAGGTSEDVTDTIAKRWSDLAAQIGENFNLRLVGLDLACDDITSPDARYSVIEVNSSPGLDHYALSGDEQRELVDQLYTKVLNAFPTM